MPPGRGRSLCMASSRQLASSCADAARVTPVTSLSAAVLGERAAEAPGESGHQNPLTGQHVVLEQHRFVPPLPVSEVYHITYCAIW
jgi:hypothetical protein